ncbi:MAG TPA: phage major capsid protein [Ornithinibacter sp.]|nr:phage major capsid protein [Ornithinibacter sp.]HQW73907.1 phage major capsid protein [Ornithinibacter sp.]
MSTIRTQLEAAVKSLETYADELDAKGVAPTGEEIAEMKNRMAEITALKEQVKAEADMRGEMADAKAFLKGLGGAEDHGAKSEKFTAEGLAMDTQGKTFGQLFIESGVYGDFTKQYVRGGVVPNQVKGIQTSPFAADAKALVTGASSTSGGAFVRNDFYTPTTDLVGERELTVADLVTRATTESDTVEYVRVTAKTNNAAPVAEATTAAAGAISGASPGPYTVAAASGVKPESGMDFEIMSTTVKTIAHWIPITKRAAADAGQVRALIDNFLLYGLAEELEDQLLNGSGVGENLTGILSSSPLTVGSAGTDIDAVVDAIAAVRTTGRRKPNALVIHPSDWYSTGFLTAKDSQGNYLIGDPRASVEQLNTLWGLRVVVTEAMTQNTALVGDFRQAVLWSREAPSILVSDQHADFFTRNLLAVLAERRDAFGVLDPQAFCTITAV